MKPRLRILIACGFFNDCDESNAAVPTSELAKALAENNLDAVRAAAAKGREALGNKAGEPEVLDEFRAVPAQARLMSRDEAQLGFTPHFATLEKMNTSCSARPAKIPRARVAGTGRKANSANRPRTGP